MRILCYQQLGSLLSFCNLPGDKKGFGLRNLSLLLGSVLSFRGRIAGYPNKGNREV